MPEQFKPSRPFTERLNEIREGQGLRYSDLETKALGARSATWFNVLVNHGTFAVNPPPYDTWYDLSVLLETTGQDIREMIAEEWYWVTPGAEVSDWVLGLAPTLERLDAVDRGLVETLIQRLMRAVGDTPDQPE